MEKVIRRSVRFVSLSILLAAFSCGKAETPEQYSSTADLQNPEFVSDGLDSEYQDKIPDFSCVGYKWGDQPIPTLPVKKTITEADVWSNTRAGGGTYADSTAYIQAMVDEVGESGGGAVLFKNGRYNVSRTIFIDHNNVVVRGESREGTVFYGDGHKGWSLFFIGASLPASSATAETDIVWNGRTLQLKSLKAAGDGEEFGDYYIYSYSPKVSSPVYSSGTLVSESFVPVGRKYVEVREAAAFAVGDAIGILRPHDPDWISDIGMDKIASNGPKRSIEKKAPVNQWSDRNFQRIFRRVVTAVIGNRIYFDAPLPQSLDVNYGGGLVQKESYAMISGCGVENLTIDSWYDKTKTMTLTVHGTGARYTSYKDENHTWKAIEIKAAEHCWVKDVDSWHMGYSCVCITTGAQNITVQGCNSYEPASYLSGGRRYAFVLEGMATKCLFRDCTVDMERHGFISNVDCGPNVYLNCTGTRMCDGPEPHQGWCLGALYDNMTVNDTHLYVRDRGNSGTGHGWAAGNYVFWNCHAYSLECSMVWSKENSPEIEAKPNGYKFHSDHPSAYNWCIGCVGLKKSGTYSYKTPYFSSDPLQEDYYIDVLGYQYRPEGFWYPKRADGTTGSDADRINLNAIPADLASQSWWPGFSGKVASFSNPESLYLSQLEDRHAQGIYINL